jgi:dihydroorotate dehydrogenase electron transfer subunit
MVPADDAIPLRGPGEQALTLHPARPRLLLIGESAGIGATLFVAERVRELSALPSLAPVSAAPPDAAPPGATLSPVPSQPAPWRPLVLLGSTGLPFRPRPSVIVVPGIPTGIIACMPLLEEWGIASRLASTLDLPGCFDGSVTALADAWLASLSAPELAEVEIFPNGPASLLQETATLAARHGVGCQAPPPGPRES